MGPLHTVKCKISKPKPKIFKAIREVRQVAYKGRISGLTARILSVTPNEGS